MAGPFSLFCSLSRECLPDANVDLSSSNFDSVLKESPASFAVVEFYAHWCPACRNYKPHYEKVARLFNGSDAMHPGIVLMVRIDCATKININLCDRFSVSYYPTLLWGLPVKFVDGKWDPNQENSEIQSIEDGRTADLLLGWINKKISRCRKGIAESLVSFDDLWPSGPPSVSSQESPVLQEEDILKSICGKDIPRYYWLRPMGSIPLPIC